MTGVLKLQAPAKVNFRLDVLKLRADGYHDLRMLMQRIDLCDEIELRLTDNPGISLRSDSAALPEGADNIVWKAAAAILSKAGSKAGVDINITKRIPVAAGLGGGSSDAATTLMGLNQLLCLGLDDKELMATGLELGADVPFFIFQKAAIAEGVGEILTPVKKMPKLWLVLVNPGIQVSTSWVYQNLRLTTEKVAARIPFLYESAADLCGILSNDLEAVTISRFPVIRAIKDQLMAVGASGSLMSGSGPTVFAIFDEQAAAQKAARKLSGTPGWFTAALSTI
jgi:4-diphosphocytidyl-2-C-methyl-D-erythritol kinase